MNLGTNVFMGENAKISWNQVTDKHIDYSTIVGSKPSSNADNTSENLSGSLGINYTQIGATYVYTGTLNANQINAGKISAQYIDAESLSVQRINQKNYEGNYIKVGGQFGDLELNYAGVNYFTIYNGIDYVSFKHFGNEYLKLSGATNTATAVGQWDFSSANVTGITATFG
ncbi:hypothetical protein [Candidatus Pristimantibacillus sp. PTI5]|uniref:hypothetical protein n=1 Tax=Candidatus Pristimantibacillus sp. PTI5 TaxID=3400422 RepID=UPI003B01ADB3